ncbi:MAG: rhamnulose-1-phosphate aldolase [Clostridia bacterium]|nr:rhamnulose-1-phosphate aldolase [Clostridia bacterium]
MKVLESAFAREFINTCEEGWQLGFHERNGGNLSYRIPDGDIDAVREDLDLSGEFVDLGTSVPELAGEFFMVTGSGKYFSHVKDDPESNVCIIEVDGSGAKYRIVWGLVRGGRPTSELPTHLMNHEVKKLASGGAMRVIYHCHPSNVIAMTFVLPLEDKVFTRELWEMITECPVVFPRGVGVVPWMVCGGREIGVYTAEKMREYDVAIWAHHGIFCAGTDFDVAFGLAHTVEKSAEVFMKVHSVTDTKRQRITKQNFLDLAAEFGLDLRVEFLD